MFRDMEARVNELKGLGEARMRCRLGLEETGRAPKSGFEGRAKAFEPFYTVEKARNSRGFAYRENKDYYREEAELAGCVALFTTCGDMGDQEIMTSYRSKESVEDCFDTQKNGLSDSRLHVHGDQAAEGKVFAMLLGLILWRKIRSRIREWQKANEATVDGAIMELEKVQYVKTAEGWRLKDAITKKQRELLKALRLDLSFMKQVETEGWEQ